MFFFKTQKIKKKQKFKRALEHVEIVIHDPCHCDLGPGMRIHVAFPNPGLFINPRNELFIKVIFRVDMT